MIIPLIIIIARLFSFVSRVFNIGMGGTWPGEIALRLKPDILTVLSRRIKEGVILISGTNGKTTTSHLIRAILAGGGKKVIINKSGANLINGVVSALITQCNVRGQLKADYAVFEVDENSLPLVISQLDSKLKVNKKLIIILLNLFRDQLDRYGEVDVIAQKWTKAIQLLDSKTTLILNADDPQIAFFGIKSNARVKYFGLFDKSDYYGLKEHATDSTFCPKCGQNLFYQAIFFSHLGIWNCLKCQLTRPQPEIISHAPILSGKYNKYNTFAAVLAARECNINQEIIIKALNEFTPAFGRQEEFVIHGKKIKVFLSKNPVGYNESLKTVIGDGARILLIILNDRIPDGRDISWIWDVDFEMIPDQCEIFLSGERVYDLALRIKYTKKNKNPKLMVEPKLNDAIKKGLELTLDNETLYILPTYSAMLEVRKILRGRKIN